MDQWNDPDLLEARESTKSLSESFSVGLQRACVSPLEGCFSVELCQLTLRGMTVEAFKEDIDHILPPEEARCGQLTMKLSLLLQKSDPVTTDLNCKLLWIRRISQHQFQAVFHFVDLSKEDYRLIASFLES